MKNKRDPRKGKISKKGDQSFEDPFIQRKNRESFEDPIFAKEGQEGFEDPIFVKIQPILQKMQSDMTFYNLITSDFTKAVAKYRLTKEEMAALKNKMGSVKRPKGTNEVTTGHDPMEL